MLPFKPQSGNPELAGSWQCLTRSFDPRTGAAIGGGKEKLVISVAGSTLRITDPAGLYFQGVFAGDRSVVFRVTDGEPPRTRQFATIAGSAINFDQDMLGQVIFPADDHLTATFLLQSRAPLGKQVQRLITFDARRLAPEK